MICLQRMRSYLGHKPDVLFVDGLGSSAECRQPLLSLLQHHEPVTSNYELKRLHDSSLGSAPSPLRRIQQSRGEAIRLRASRCPCGNGGSRL
jgi:hypothetical protein